MIEGWVALLLIMGSCIALMFIGMPVVFSFLTVTMVGVILLWGGQSGLEQLVLSIFDTLSTFSFIPLPLFILMGELMFNSGLASDMIDALDKWIGRVPGRLGLLAVGAGTMFSTLTGSSMSSVAMLGSTLVPQMRERNYGKLMTLGPILGSGGLAMMIPPSGMAVLIGALAEVSIGDLWMAIVIPGLLMAFLYASYIIITCKLKPAIAPPYPVSSTTLSDKIVSSLKYILPLGGIFFLVVGLIIFGIATPSESAAAGTFGCIILSAAHGRVNWNMFKKSVLNSAQIAGMVLIIIAGAGAFSQILAFTGGSKFLIGLATELPVAPIVIIIAMQVILIFLGMFMTIMAILMITIPLFMPVILSLGFDPIWFCVLFMLNMEMGTTSPPFGLSLFVMKSLAPDDVTIGDCYRAALPFLGCDLIAMALIIAFPVVALWLPSIAR